MVMYFGTTVWSGSAFDCAGGEIILLHSLYDSTESHVRAYGECNNGSIVAQGITIKNGTYTSRLNISVSTDMIGRSIECLYDATNSILVGSAIILTSGKGVSSRISYTCTFSFIHHQSISHHQISVK